MFLSSVFYALLITGTSWLFKFVAKDVFMKVEAALYNFLYPSMQLLSSRIAVLPVSLPPCESLPLWPPSPLLPVAMVFVFGGMVL